MILLDVGASHIHIRETELLISGSVKIYICQFIFSPEWDGLDRTATFSAGPVSRSVVLDTTNACRIPWEVLSCPGGPLRVGVVGTNGGEIVRPSVMADLGRILPGTKSGELTREPTPGVYEQILSAANRAAENAAAVRQDAAEGKFNGADGLTPYIKDGNWWIGTEDTGVQAAGSAEDLTAFRAEIQRLITAETSRAQQAEQANAAAAEQANQTADQAAAAAGQAQTDLNAEVQRAQTAEAANARAAAQAQGDVNALVIRVDAAVGTDEGKSIRTIATEVLAEKLIPENARQDLNKLQEIANWIQSHPGDAAAMDAAISALQAKVDTGDKTVAAYVADAIAALKIGDYAMAADLTALAARVSTAEGKISTLETAAGNNAAALAEETARATAAEGVNAQAAADAKDAANRAAQAVSDHNTAAAAHNDIRLLIQGIITRLNALADSDDTTLDQMAEVVAYIKDNRDLIGQVTTGKVSVEDIVDNLTTSAADKPLSAKQGVALKALVDALTSTVAGKALTADLTAALTRITTLEAAKHTHSNKALLDTYTQTEANLASAVSQKHGHSNKSELDLIQSGNVSAWNNARSGALSDAKTWINQQGFYKGTTADIIAAVNASQAVPDYVITEADSVIDRILAALGPRSIVIAAATDLHLGNGGYTDGVTHMAQALDCIGSRIHIDILAVLGDYTDGYPASGLANALGDIMAINAMMDGIHAPTLRQQGNHDYYPDNAPITRRLIQQCSDDVVWGSITGGYYYRDFEDHKLRIISVNTTELGNDNIYCSTQQYQWFADTLDLSSKTDAADWQILIMSHHPLDWWTSGDVGYLYPEIIQAYNDGTSGSSAGVTYDYTGGKNAARIIANIHGHIHNLLTGKMYLNLSNTAAGDCGTYRMCTPEACIGRENQYTGVWAEAASYPKVQDTADDTAFCVYCIDLDNHIINAICYGAGYDRTVSYLDAPVYHTVTSSLSNITSSNSAAEILHGSQYVATISAAAGYQIDSCTVTMGGVDITATAYSDGAINIASVTGNITITATAIAAGPSYTNLLPLATDKDLSTIYNGVGYAYNKRINSSDNVVDCTELWWLTGCIPVKSGDVVRIKDYAYITGSGYYSLCLYDSNMARIAGGTYNYTNLIALGTFAGDANTPGLLTFTVPTFSGCAYMRMLIAQSSQPETCIITVNQPIE